MKFWEKENIEEPLPIDGLIEDARDYDFYDMTIKDKMIGFTIGFLLGFLAIFMFFGIWIVSLVVGAVIGLKTIPIYKKKIIEKNKKKLLLQFRDLLDSLNNSMAAGNNITDSFTNAYEDMANQYGELSYIADETMMIITGLNNGLNIEELLENFAQRSHCEDIQDFCNTFNTCIRLGGNLKVVVNECRDTITQKIDIEMEIQTIIAGNKNQLNIIIVMPFVIIGLMSFMGFSEIMSFNITTVVTKIIALIVFVIAYLFGLKITKIEM